MRLTSTTNEALQVFESFQDERLAGQLLNFGHAAVHHAITEQQLYELTKPSIFDGITEDIETVNYGPNSDSTVQNVAPLIHTGDTGAVVDLGSESIALFNGLLAEADMAIYEQDPRLGLFRVSRLSMEPGAFQERHLDPNRDFIVAYGTENSARVDVEKTATDGSEGERSEVLWSASYDMEPRDAMVYLGILEHEGSKVKPDNRNWHKITNTSRENRGSLVVFKEEG